jgi:hypothetical protein
VHQGFGMDFEHIHQSNGELAGKVNHILRNRSTSHFYNSSCMVKLTMGVGAVSLSSNFTIKPIF